MVAESEAGVKTGTEENNLEALLTRAVSAYDQGDLQTSLVLCNQVLERNARRIDAIVLRGILKRRLGHPNEAIADFRAALELNPRYAEAHHSIANAYLDIYQNDKAIEHYRAAIDIKPDWVQPYVALGNALREKGDYKESEAVCRSALKLDKDLPDAHLNLGTALYEQNRWIEAVDEFETVVKLDPNNAKGFYNLGNTYRDFCELDQSLANYRKALKLEPEMTKAFSNYLFTLHSHPEQTPETLLQAHMEWDKLYGQPRRKKQVAFQNANDPDKTLRIGLVSSDLGKHPVGFFLSPILPELIKQDVEIYCYSDRSVEDDLSKTLQTSVTKWQRTRHLNEDQLAALIRNDGIDILIDLAGHTAGNRLPVFAQKPAPVQATWAGYVGTTGLESIDYLISDDKETPSGYEAYHRESLLLMPDGYVCYRAPDYAPAVSPLPALENGYVTFGCANNLIKINRAVVELWSEILVSIPNSRLHLITKGLGNEQVRAKYLELFEKQGIDADRITLSAPVPHEQLLNWYTTVDIALDPFPYSGGLTTLESLWMGVPVITLEGNRFESRHSITHLSNAGFPDLIADNELGYLEKAQALASDLPGLEELRQTLREKMVKSPLCDGKRFADNFHRKLREVWKRWCDNPIGKSDPVLTALHQAMHQFRGGDYETARKYAAAVIESDSRNIDALNLLGVINRKLGHVDVAIANYHQALAVKPDSVEVLRNLGNALKAKGETDQAIDYYKKGHDYSSNDAGIIVSLCEAYREQKKLEDAKHYIEKLEQIPNLSSEAINCIGNYYCDVGDLDRAIAFYQSAIERDSSYPFPYRNLAITYKRLGNYEAAVGILEASIARDVNSEHSHILLGDLLKLQGDWDSAITHYEKATTINPKLAEIYNNMGSIRYGQGKLNEALHYFNKAVETGLESAVVHANIGNVYNTTAQLEKALAAYQKAESLNPDDFAIKINIIHILQKFCDWEHIHRIREDVVDQALDSERPISPFPFLSLPVEISGQEILTLAERFASHQAEPVVSTLANGTYLNHEKIRIGYVSADFHDHATSHLMAGLFPLHDRSRFEIYGYSLGPDDNSTYRKRVVEGFDHFHDIAPLSSRQIAERIYADEIDIAIDLKGYTGGARPEIFAHRPAPIQVAYLGYPGTMGADYIDYVITDKIVTPVEEQDNYREKFAYVPGSYQVNDQQQTISETPISREECQLPEDAFVFCCFNAMNKIEPGIFKQWMQILSEVDGSVLWLVSGNDVAKSNIGRYAEEEGIDPERIIFAPKMKKSEHLARLRNADLGLDTYYYNAHTTASDLLWAGVPYITCPGHHFASRVGASLLRAIGMEELIVSDFSRYRRKAIELAKKPKKITELKRKLEKNKDNHLLFDTEKFARHVEEIYEIMVKNSHDGNPPAIIDVAGQHKKLKGNKTLNVKPSGPPDE